MSNDKYEEVVLDVDSNDPIHSIEDIEAETEEVEMFDPGAGEQPAV